MDYVFPTSLWCMENLIIYIFDEVWSNPAQRKRIKYLGRVSKEKILQKNGARLRRRLLEQILCHHTQQSQVCEDYNTSYKKEGWVIHKLHSILKALVVKNSVLHDFGFGKVSQIHETFLMELQLFG